MSHDELAEALGLIKKAAKILTRLGKRRGVIMDRSEVDGKPCKISVEISEISEADEQKFVDQMNQLKYGVTPP